VCLPDKTKKTEKGDPTSIERRERGGLILFRVISQRGRSHGARTRKGKGVKVH